MRAKGSSFSVGDVPFETALTGRHSVMNLLAAIAVAMEFGIAPESLRDAVRTFSAGKMRGERIEIEVARRLQGLLAAVPTLLLGAAHQGRGQSGNVLTNPGFESGTTGWTFYTNGAGTFSSVTPGFEGSRSGRISITTAGTNVQLAQVNYSRCPQFLVRMNRAPWPANGRPVSVTRVLTALRKAIVKSISEWRSNLALTPPV